MAKPSPFAQKMRVYHRYLGFFLAGIMAVYALSGIVLIFRDTDFLKQEKQYTKTVDTQLDAEALGKALGIKRLAIERTEGEQIYFKEGIYNANTGEASYALKKLPYVLDQMTHLHKAKSADPLYWLNIFFGLSLLFFVISSFWMFMPQTSIFKKGLYFTLAGIVLTLILLFV